jgi:hypothetical protein
VDKLKHTLTIMRWFLAVGRKFLRVAPASTMIVVF